MGGSVELNALDEKKYYETNREIRGSLLGFAVQSSSSKRAEISSSREVSSCKHFPSRIGQICHLEEDYPLCSRNCPSHFRCLLNKLLAK